MESGRSLFHSSNNNYLSNNGSGEGRWQDDSNTDHNSNCTSNDAPRAIWSSAAPPTMDWIHPNFFHQPATTVIANPVPQGGGGEGVFHALTVHNNGPLQSVSPFTSSLYRGGGGGGGVGGSQYCCYPDPHPIRLKLGKRHYFGDAATPLGDRHDAAAFANANAADITKRGKPYCELVGTASASGGMTVANAAAAAAPVATAIVPRCQVDGCHVALVNAKDYHKRHKVCEMHSKAPKAVVLGLEQRFCQQCSRFHAVGEFDESKRSCRRRLAGHNERRRKSSQDHQSTAPKNPSRQGEVMTHGGRHPYVPLSNGCALSLLSSKNDAWISSADLPARCSAALSELIAENRAANVLARRLILVKDWHSGHQRHHEHHHPDEGANNGRQNGSTNCSSLVHYQQQMAAAGSHGWDHVGEAAGGGHVTLDLMQAPNSAFGFLSVRGGGKSKEEDEECPDLWGSFGGAHVV